MKNNKIQHGVALISVHVENGFWRAGREPGMGPELSHYVMTFYAHNIIILLCYGNTIDNEARGISINLKVNLIFRVNCHVIFVLIMTVAAQDGIYYLTQYDNNIIRTFSLIFSKGTQR